MRGQRGCCVPVAATKQPNDPEARTQRWYKSFANSHRWRRWRWQRAGAPMRLSSSRQGQKLQMNSQHATSILRGRGVKKCGESLRSWGHQCVFNVEGERSSCAGNNCAGRSCCTRLPCFWRQLLRLSAFSGCAPDFPPRRHTSMFGPSGHLPALKQCRQTIDAPN